MCVFQALELRGPYDITNLYPVVVVTMCALVCLCACVFPP